MSQRVPDWVLERYLVGELPPDFTEADIAADPTAQERLAALRTSDAEILSHHPPRVVAAGVHTRAEQRRIRPARPPFMQWLPAAATAALVAVLVPAVLTIQRTPDLLTKGLEPHLEVYRQEPGGEARALADGAAGRPGDLIQLRVVPAGAQFGVVVAVDSAGAATLVAPASEGPALQLPRSGSLTLPDALQLDAAGGFERFILVTSDHPFQAGDVLAAARRLGAPRSDPLPLPAGLRQSAFLLIKTP